LFKLSDDVLFLSLGQFEPVSMMGVTGFYEALEGRVVEGCVCGYCLVVEDVFGLDLESGGEREAKVVNYFVHVL